MTKGIRLVRLLIFAGRPPLEIDSPPRGRQFLAALVILTTLIVVAHGCHGPDEDHEPATVPAAGKQE